MKKVIKYGGFWIGLGVIVTLYIVIDEPNASLPIAAYLLGWFKISLSR